jgi:hypothetical protein
LLIRINEKIEKSKDRIDYYSLRGQDNNNLSIFLLDNLIYLGGMILIFD